MLYKKKHNVIGNYKYAFCLNFKTNSIEIGEILKKLQI